MYPRFQVLSVVDKADDKERAGTQQYAEADGAAGACCHDREEDGNAAHERRRAGVGLERAVRVVFDLEQPA